MKRDKPDANRAELVKAARKFGGKVYDIGRPVDLLVGIRGTWFPVELKSPGGRYTASQKQFAKECDAAGLQMLTWRTVEDVLEAFK